MQRLLTSDVWPELGKLSAASKTRHAAIAYVTSATTLRFGRGDTLVVDASDESIASGRTTASVLGGAVRRGAVVVSVANLHAKVLVLDSGVAVGSANLSGGSTRLAEAVLVTDAPGVRGEARSWIEALARQGTRVDRAFIKRVAAIPVSQRRSGGPPRKPSLLQALQSGSPQLSDLAFGIYTQEARVTDRDVKRAAKSHRILLPKGDDWTHFEDPYSRAARDGTNRRLGSRTLIAFTGVAGADGVLERVSSLDNIAYSYIAALKVGGTLVTLCDMRKQAPVLLGGADAKTLCRLMTVGLSKVPNIRRTIKNAPGEYFLAPTLLKLVRTGQQATEE